MSVVWNEAAMVCWFGRFYLVRVSASKRGPKRMQLSLFFWNWLRILIDFRFADLRIIRISAFPVYVSSCIWPCRAGWIERIVALKSQFSDLKSNLLSWFYDSRANSYLWLVVLPSYLPRNVTHSFTCFECLVVTTGFKYGRIPAVSKAH